MANSDKDNKDSKGKNNKLKKSKLIQEVDKYVFKFLSENLPDEMLYHDFVHTQETVEAVEEIAAYYDLSDNDFESLLLGAYFHDIGYTRIYINHEEESKKIAREFLEGKISENQLALVLDLINSTKFTQPKEGLLQEILHDSDVINIGKKKFFRKAVMLRLEWEKYLDLKDTDIEWNDRQLQFLMQQKFLTKYAQLEYQKGRNKNIESLKNEMVKTEVNDVKRNKIGRGIETMYRAVYRSHIDLSSMADQKANMMISINTILVSIVMAAIGSGFTFTGHDFIKHLRFVVPMGILIFGCLISVAFAIISATPKVTRKKVSTQDITEKKSSVLFFGNFVQLKLKDFIESLNLLREDQDVVYDHMTIDLYYLGHVLQKKYKLLAKCYISFLITIILSVMTFLVIFIVSQ